jgi:hypothetical protein
MSFARLALASHVLYEREIVEQRQEIEALKRKNAELELKLFWKDYGVAQLKEAMQSESYRRRQSHPNESQRYNLWYEWMGPIVKACDMEASCCDDENTHLICKMQNYYMVSYATRLRNAKSVEDPELQKLKTLFRCLLHT